MKHKYILSLDPSGNYHEGKGTTGWCLLDTESNQVIQIGSLNSSEYSSMESYWNMHLQLLEQIKREYSNYMLVIEDYLLYNSKKDNQVNSRMETPKLIGALQLYCYQNKMNYTMQTASEVKNRWSDEVLVHKGYLLPRGGRFYTGVNFSISVNRHMKDAIRHAVHYKTFKNKED